MVSEPFLMVFPYLRLSLVDLLSIALILSSRSLPLISEEKLKALPLEILLQLLTATISTAFLAGKFLSSPPVCLFTRLSITDTHGECSYNNESIGSRPPRPILYFPYIYGHWRCSPHF